MAYIERDRSVTIKNRSTSGLYATLAFCVFILCATLSSSAKEDWQSDLHKWTTSSQTNPNCKVRYTTGIYRPGIGDGPQWGLMSEKMYRWFSKDGMKRAPFVCLANSTATANYRILISETPVRTISSTTHGAETRTSTQPFNANVTSRTTYPDGSTTNTRGTINGEQTTTVVVTPSLWPRIPLFLI